MKYLPTWLNMKYLIYLHFRPSKPSLTVSMDPRSPNKLIVRKYWRWYKSLCLSSFFFVCMFFCSFCNYKSVFKNYFLLLFYLFFLKNYFNFFTFRDVPKCSVFRVLSTLARKFEALNYKHSHSHYYLKQVNCRHLCS